ncbi:MAG: hypothetical protein IJE84_02815, partial [Clostridia bacterium]|nr:hypothetical protein [Clostridia bacterium]
TLPSVVGLEAAFAIYLGLRVLARVVENILIAVLFGRRYPQVDLKIKESIPRTETKDLLDKIKALFVHKLAGLSLQATSSLIVTKFVDVIRGGFYGNYLSLSNAINTIGTQFFGGITASFGDLYVSVDKNESYRKFRCIFFVNYLLYSFFAISYFVISEPFVQLWIGSREAVFAPAIVALMAIYIYMYGIRQCLFVARNVTGEYTKDRWFAVVEALINFVIGVFLVAKIGVIGIPIGNIVSMLAVPFWVQSGIVYRDIFGARVSDYYKSYGLYFLVFIIGGGLTYTVCTVVSVGNVLFDFAIRIAACAVIPNVINILAFCKTEEFLYVKQTAFSLLSRFKNK